MAALALGSDGELQTPKQRSTGQQAAEPNGRPATHSARLSTWWRVAGGPNQRVLRTRWRQGGRAVIVGRLATAANRSIVGARIGVLAADASAPRQGSRTVGEVSTDARGRFATAVALDRGAPRKLLTFTYLAHSGDEIPTATARVRLEVVGPISARASTLRTRRRNSVRLQGRSPGEASVQILVREPGRRWRTSSSAQATRTGRWEAAVYIPSYAPRGTYRLRARVLGDKRRGFLPAESQPLTVEVR